MFCETDNILQNILHVHFEYGEYTKEYCQSHGTLLWILIMLCLSYTGAYFESWLKLLGPSLSPLKH